MFKKAPHVIGSFVVLTLAILMSAMVQSPTKKFNISSDSLQNSREQAIWIDSVFATLSEDQKIGQLFIVAAFSNKDEQHCQRIERQILENHVGGLLFFQGTPFAQAQLTNRYQALAKVPLLISMDAEWGLAMRLKEVTAFPRHITIGATTDPALAYQIGTSMASQFQRMGVHLNFAPVADINSNAENPIIGNRSFGEEKENVAEKSIAFAKGLQDNHILACAKHFPGHGDTETDSHIGLPLLNHSQARLNDTELYPFRRLFADGIKSVIIGHLNVPFYEDRLIPATLSHKIVTNLLKTEMGFSGLVITDALNMRGVTNNAYGDVEVQALMAGNDILLYSENVPEAIRQIKDAIASHKLSWEIIDAKVRKILHAKYWVGLHKPHPISLNNLYVDLHTPEIQQTKQNLYENAVTVIRNDKNLLPLVFSDTTRQIISMAIGVENSNAFQQTLNQYAPFQLFASESKNDEIWQNSMLQKADSARLILLSLHNLTNVPSRNFGISQSTIRFIEHLQAKAPVVLCIFGSPYLLKHFANFPTLVCGYEDEPTMYMATAQALMGAIPTRGKLPISVAQFKAGTGLEISLSGMLANGQPENVGMNSKILAKIDTLVGSYIQQKIFPGCQLLVARQGRIILKKNYGTLSYNSSETVQNHTLYDLASVTKVAATLQAIMWLYERQKIDLNQKASYYLPELRNTNKANTTIRDILMHQAGFVAYLPFWEKTINKGYWKNGFYNTVPSVEYPFQVAESMYATATMPDSVWKWVIQSPLINLRTNDGKFKMVYSDLGLITLQKVIEEISKEPLNIFVAKIFFEPLGMKNTDFQPIDKFPIAHIAPTERDKLFRMSELRGTVQDQTAAMVGGVSGHAGLFSSASDLAILMQMQLQYGFYGSQRYLQGGTIAHFTKTQQEGNHRGLGWDKRPTDGESNYISSKVSASSFGHSGYTGTMVWADPEKQLIFIFLSNRIHPNASDNRINTLKIRRKIQDIVYNSLMN